MKYDKKFAISFIISVIVFFASAVTHIELFTILALILLCLSIYYLIRFLVKNKNQMIINFKKQHFIVRLLMIVSIICLICDIFLNHNLTSLTWTPFFVFLIAGYADWFFKKEE